MKRSGHNLTTGPLTCRPLLLFVLSVLFSRPVPLSFFWLAVRREQDNQKEDVTREHKTTHNHYHPAHYLCLLFCELDDSGCVLTIVHCLRLVWISLGFSLVLPLVLGLDPWVFSRPPLSPTPSLSFDWPALWSLHQPANQRTGKELEDNRQTQRTSKIDGRLFSVESGEEVVSWFWCRQGLTGLSVVFFLCHDRPVPFFPLVNGPIRTKKRQPERKRPGFNLQHLSTNLSGRFLSFYC